MHILNGRKYFFFNFLYVSDNLQLFKQQKKIRIATNGIFQWSEFDSFLSFSFTKLRLNLHKREFEQRKPHSNAQKMILYAHYAAALAVRFCVYVNPALSWFYKLCRILCLLERQIILKIPREVCSTAVREKLIFFFTDTEHVYKIWYGKNVFIN